MYLYFLRVVFTVVKVVKVSSQSFSHRFIVICICPTKATYDTYARSFFPQKCASRRHVCHKKQKIYPSSSFKSHVFDFIRFFCLCLSPLLVRLFQNRDDHDDVYCDDVFVDDDFSLLFREEAFTISTNEKKN